MGISIILLVLFLITVDLRRMLDSLADANYIYLIPAVGVYLIAVVFRTLRWQVLLRHMRSVSVQRLFPVVVIGYMANNILPMRLGELVRSYYVGEREGISKASALVTIFVERILDALTLLFFIAAIALFVPLSGLAAGFSERSGIASPLLIVAFSGPFVIVFVTLILFALFPERTREFAALLIRPLPQRFEVRLLNLIDYFLHGLIPLRSPKTLALLFSLSLPVWLFETGLFFFIGYSFGLHEVYDSLWHMLVAMVLVTAIANIGSSVPAAPGGIGIFELIARETLVLLPLAAVDRSVAAGFAAVTHAALLLPMIILGQVFLWAGHISLRKLSKAGSSEQVSSSENPLPTDGSTLASPSVGED